MNALIDTNVILDAVAARVPFNASAERLFLLAAEGKVSACITASSVTDICYLLQKHLHDASRSREVLSKLFRLFSVLDVTGSDCRKALTIPMPDYEDTLLAACAKRCKTDPIITRDHSGFDASPVRASTPEGLLTGFKE